MASRSDTNVMVNYYIKAWEKRYSAKANVNRYSAHWGFSNILDHLNKEQVKGLLDFYFTTTSGKRHDVDWFFWNYEKLIDGKSNLDRDLKHRAKLEEETRIRTEQWKAKHGKQGTANA